MSEVAIKIDDLKNSGSPLSAWIKEGLKYYRNKKYDIFIEILEAANAHKFEPYSDHDQEYMLLLDTIAAYYAQAGQREKQPELKKEYFNKATLIYNNADKIIMYDENHLVGRAYFCLIEGEKIAQADSQFNFVINQNPKNLKALIGKAYIYFHKRDFKSALNLFKKALRINPNAPADIRIGIGHCFLKLGNFEKAKMAYERALEIDLTNCQALLGLGVLNLNKKTAESIKVGINYLSKAYSVDPTNAMVLNLLADHFFYKKDLEKVTKLSHQAFNSTENESIKAESSFQVARVFHYRKNYEDAYKYYYQSVQFASPLYIAPLFGLAQMYIEHREFENALQSINKILKHYPDNNNALKLHIYVSRKLYKNEKKDLVLSNCDKILKNSPFDLFALISSAYYFEDQNYQQALDNYKKVLSIFDSEYENMLTSEIMMFGSKAQLKSVIYNNIGCLKYLMGNYRSSLNYFEDAKSLTLNSSLISHFNHNIAITNEKLDKFSEAVAIYQEILRSDPSQIVCDLRLGQIKADNGNFIEAKEHIESALQKTPNDLDALTLLAQLYEKRKELSLAQKTYDKILVLDSKDTYTLLSLGNIWLASAHHTSDKTEEKVIRHLDRALNYYKQVLKLDSHNIFAANGIGCVLAHKGFLNEARDIFSQIKEMHNHVEDVWLNMGHIYFELKQYGAAAKMYENCIQKFHSLSDREILTNLGRAHLKNRNLSKAFAIMNKVLIISPDHLPAIYNAGMVIQQQALNIMTSDNSTLNEVHQSIKMLEIASGMFERTKADSDHSSSSLRINAEHLASQIKYIEDLITQSSQYLDMAHQREMKKEEALKDQIAQLERLEQEKSHLAKLESEKQLEEMKKIEEQRQFSLLKTKNSVAALRQKNIDDQKAKNRPEIQNEINNDEPYSAEESDNDRINSNWKFNDFENSDEYGYEDVVEEKYLRGERLPDTEEKPKISVEKQDSSDLSDLGNIFDD